MSDAQNEVKYLVFDVEAVPDVGLIKDVKFPSENLSDEEAIRKFKDEMLEITDGRSDFIPVTFMKPVSVVIAKILNDFTIKEIVSLDEPEFKVEIMTKRFWFALEDLYPKAAIVTFNGRGFDVPLLELMAYRYGIQMKTHFNDKFGTRQRYGTRHIDLQELLSNNHAIKMAGGLNLLSKVLGLPGKMDTDGSQVYDMYVEGKMKEINDYCICDVLDTYFVFLRSRVLIGKITLEQEAAVKDRVKEFLNEKKGEIDILNKYLEIMKDGSPYL
ncbi:MAG: 3'-5' exonuclease [Spirochaetes bacterium]|nr:3'-5' exonuclease [Spirochaetota bacterium]